MFDLFYQGGPLFMSILTIILIASQIFAVKGFLSKANPAIASEHFETVKNIGIFGAVIGLLGFLIGMYAAMARLEEVGNISQGVLAGGLKVASITPTYGLMICAISYLLSIIGNKSI